MNEETAIIQSPGGDLAGVSALAEEFSKATRLTRYQEGRLDQCETCDRESVLPPGL
jgi:hypothetical protein